MTIKFRAELKQKRAELKCSALILTFRPYDLLTSKPSELSALRTFSLPISWPLGLLLGYQDSNLE